MFFDATTPTMFLQIENGKKDLVTLVLFKSTSKLCAWKELSTGKCFDLLVYEILTTMTVLNKSSE